MKRDSARLIIALVALAAILALCAYAVPSIASCRPHFIESYCAGLRMRLYFELAAVLASQKPVGLGLGRWRTADTARTRPIFFGFSVLSVFRKVSRV